MREQLVWRYILDKKCEGIYLGGKSLYCIQDQNKLSDHANGQSEKPTVLLRHEAYGNRRAL